MRRFLVTATTAAAFAGTTVFAETIAEQVVSQLQAAGYQRIEIKNGLSQVKVEAIRDGMELEVVYDTATGAILKQEVNPADASDRNRTGVEIKTERRNFVDVAGADDEDDDRDDDERDDDRDDERDDERDDDEDDDEDDEDDDDEEDEDDDEDDDENDD